MRKALRSNPSRAQVASTRAIPAPVGGWDTESPLAAMPAKNAIILENFIPRAAYVELRRGYMQHVTGTADPVESLIAWRGAAIGDKLLACAGANIYDTTASGSLGAALYSAAINARWQAANFSNDAAIFAICVNGANTPQKFDGTAFGDLTITGASGPIVLDPTTLSDVMSHKKRLMFLELGSLRIWYLPVNAIQGACGLLDMGGYFYKGGQLIDCATWSLDGGAGIDDLAVFISSEGQVAVFQGTDPGDTANWSLVGVYDLAKPLGTRALIKYGADLVVLTEDGVVPLSQALNKDRAQDDQVALTAKIATAFSKAASSYRTNYGWQGLLYPGRGSLAIFNIPTANLATADQYVQSMQTGAWCRFTGLNAFCWELANDGIYFGSTDGVYQWDIGSTDDGGVLSGDIKPAFGAFGSPLQQKQFTMIKAIMKAPAIIRPALEVLTDYREAIPTATPTVVDPGDISPDDEDAIRDDWTGAAGVGYVATPRMRVAITGITAANRILIEPGATDVLVTGDGDTIIERSNIPLDVTVQVIGFGLLYTSGSPL